MGLFSFIFGLSETVNENEKNTRKNKLEQEMSWNHLDDYERNEVRKGNDDVSNFEDSEDVDLDEDDYYYDK